MELMVKPENMQNHNLKVIRIYYAVEELIGVLNEEHKGSIPEVLRVLFHVHSSTTNIKVRELVLAVYPAIGKTIFLKISHLISLFLQQRS
jgi:hypothetical protein